MSEPTSEQLWEDVEANATSTGYPGLRVTVQALLDHEVAKATTQQRARYAALGKSFEGACDWLERIIRKVDPTDREAGLEVVDSYRARIAALREECSA